MVRIFAQSAFSGEEWLFLDHIYSQLGSIIITSIHV
jgi:hypothetical protein